MKLALRAIQFNSKKNTLRKCNVLFHQNTASNFTLSQILISKSQKYQFTTSKSTQNNEGNEKHPESKDFKLQQLKELFETKMNKYNLKGLLKMYQILKHNNVKLTQQSLKEFDYRLTQQLNSLDHQSTNSILELSYRNGQKYQPKGKNKLLRGINLKIQKNKINLQPQHVYNTIKLLIQMNFPKSTLSRALFKLVIENQPQKRVLYQIDNLSSLKICLIVIQNVELELQLKRRMLENLLLIKPKGVIQLTYFYSILKIVVQKLQQTVSYQAHKKTVYDLAFNPYSFSQFDQETTQMTNKNQQNRDKNTQNDKNEQTEKQNQQKTKKSEINDTILKNLINQKDKILEQTFKKFNLEKVSEQLCNQLNEILQDPENDDLKFKDKKQICTLLLTNKFGIESNKNKKLLTGMINEIINQGLGDIKSVNEVNTGNMIRVNQFVYFIGQLSKSSEKGVINGWIKKYKQFFYSFMSLLQKWIFTYHSTLIMNQKISIQSIKQEVMQIDYGLNAQEFVWLNKLLTLNQQKNSEGDKKLIKQIWKHVETTLDQEITEMKKHKEEQQKSSQQNQRKNQENTSQNKDELKNNEREHEKNKN